MHSFVVSWEGLLWPGIRAPCPRPPAARHSGREEGGDHHDRSTGWKGSGPTSAAHMPLGQGTTQVLSYCLPFLVPPRDHLHGQGSCKWPLETPALKPREEACPGSGIGGQPLWAGTCGVPRAQGLVQKWGRVLGPPGPPYWFSSGAVRKCHSLSGFNNRNVSSHSSGSRTSQSGCGRGRGGASPPPLHAHVAFPLCVCPCPHFPYL